MPLAALLATACSCRRIRCSARTSATDRNPQHVALLPVAHQERPVVGPLLADRSDARARREAPQRQQRGGELQAGRC